jgi:hypothetical protein
LHSAIFSGQFCSTSRISIFLPNAAAALPTAGQLNFLSAIQEKAFEIIMFML